jgi:hypothetical protein
LSLVLNWSCFFAFFFSFLSASSHFWNYSLVPLPIILLIVNMYRHYSPRSSLSASRLDLPTISTGRVHNNFRTSRRVGSGFNLSTWHGGSGYDSFSDEELGLYYSRPPRHGGSGFDASLRGGSGFDVDLGDANGYDDCVRYRGFGFSPTWHGRGGHAFDEQGFFPTATWVTTTCPPSMGLVVPVLLLLGGAVQALTPILVAVPATIVDPTTRPLGICMVALALLLLGPAVLALRPISVAVLALMAMQTIHGFSTRPIRVVVVVVVVVMVVILTFLGAILALVRLVNSPYWMLPVSHWMPERFIPHVVGPVSHWMLARISPLAVGPVSHWILAMILLLFFDRMTLTTISAPLPIASSLVSHWMPARISLLAVGPVSHWILAMILLRFFGRMPLTRFSPLTIASGPLPHGMQDRITPLAESPVSNWILATILLYFFGHMPLTRISQLKTVVLPWMLLALLKTILHLLTGAPNLVLSQGCHCCLVQKF